MNKPGNPQHDHIDTHTRQPWWPGIISIVAERMSRRAMRRATTFPMLATFGANALAVELCRRGEDHEAIAAAAGIQYVSQLRKVAGVLPHAAQAGAKIVVAANTLLAESLLKAGEAVKVHDYSCTKKSNDTQ